MKKTFTQILFVLFALVSFTANAGSGIFIRGGLNSWVANPEWEFVDKGDGVYTLDNKTLLGEFKIGNSDWSTIDYGSNGNELKVEENYTLSAKGSNFKLEAPIVCDEIKLTILNGVATLYLTGQVTEPEEITKVYVMGDNNKWDFSDNSGVLYPIDGSKTSFEGEITFPKKEDGTLSFWRIYENLGSVGSWGFEENTSIHTVAGTFERGKEGCATVNSGLYKITFDLENGVFSATPLSSVGSIDTDESSVTVSNGVITVTGDATTVDVYSVSGSLISTNKKSIEVQPGVYIVIVDNKATKVAVK